MNRKSSFYHASVNRSSNPVSYCNLSPTRSLSVSLVCLFSFPTFYHALPAAHKSVYSVIQKTYSMHEKMSACKSMWALSEISYHSFSLSLSLSLSFYLRLVLSSVSDYFAAMFTSDVREAKQEEIKMEGVDPDALWVLVQYAYTGVCLSGRMFG